MAERTWKCQRQSGGVKCGAVNPRRLHICPACGKRRPATTRPAHRAVLDIPYELWVEIFGPLCGICGRAASDGRRLDRDHTHEGDGAMRGLLCHSCNRTLWHGADLDWAKRVVAYFERASLRALIKDPSTDGGR